jgi:hypothetical protein
MTRNGGDINFDGTVDFWDLSGFSPAYGKTSGQAGYQDNLDFDNTGVIDYLDLSAFSNRYGSGCSYTAP